MHPVLNRNLYLVKEHLGLFKAASNYDIFDPETNELILHCREERLGFLTQLLRFTDYRRNTPFDIEVRTPSGEPVLHVRRGITLLRSKVDVLDGDEHGTRIGGFQQKLLSIGGAFQVLDANDQPLCHLKGKWTGWNFRFLAGEHELAQVSKKWKGLNKEMFTTADSYVLSISPDVPPDSQIRQLILAAVLCIDMVLKE
jgi:uncharacterized protein YxjI